jgi:hypothetical protein
MHIMALSAKVTPPKEGTYTITASSQEMTHTEAQEQVLRLWLTSSRTNNVPRATNTSRLHDDDHRRSNRSNHCSRHSWNTALQEEVTQNRAKLNAPSFS